MPGLRVSEPISDRFSAALDYQIYGLLKKLSGYDEDVIQQLEKLAKKIAVQMKDRIFSGKYLMSVVAFLQEFESACDARGIHEGDTVWLFKQFITGPSNAPVKP